MVSPLLLAGVAGIAGGTLLSQWLGGGGETKKETTSSQSQGSMNISPYAFFAPVQGARTLQYNPSVQYGIQYQSPNASQDFTKKDMLTSTQPTTSTPSFYPSYTPVQQSAQPSTTNTGLDILPLAIIGIGAFLVLKD